MDINLLREGVMIVGLLAFGGIVWWAYAPSRKGRFERDARAMFDDDARDARPGRDGEPGKGA